VRGERRDSRLVEDHHNMRAVLGYKRLLKKRKLEDNTRNLMRK
jgi:hypothetical protein